MCYCFYNDMERPITSTVSHGGGTAVQLAANTYDELGSLASRQVDGEGGWHYYIKDYQGNVRAVIDQQGALEEVNNYYPYGSLMGGGTVGNNASVQPYKYGTKELDRQNGLDWYDSQARHYDPLLGRTPTMDPKAEDYAPISPYAWCAGNPVLLSDPTGKDAIISVDGNRITVNITIVLTGQYATNDLAEDYKQSIMNTWGACSQYESENGEVYGLSWNVDVIVNKDLEKGERTFDGKTNYMEVTPAFVASYVKENNHGVISSDFRQGNPMVHEFGHFLGLKDHYHLSSNKREREKGKQYPDLGWGNNIMGTTADRGIVEQRNFHQVFRTINNIERSVNMIRKAFRTAPSFTPQMKYNYIINKYTREW